MKVRYFLVSLLFTQFVFFDLQSQHYDNAVVMREFDINTDKQAIKAMMTYDWEFLCGCGMYDYREAIVEERLKMLTGSCKVLYKENELIGFIKYSMETDNCAHINTLAVHKDHRKNGFASMLLQYACHDIASWNIDYITIDVRFDNEPARNLYRNRFGFTPLYLKYYKFPNHEKESVPILSLGRTIDPLQWNEQSQQAIMLSKGIASARPTGGVTYRLVRIDNEI
jgi:ribosomal protein S18 acetylase RimI-like enzyme